MPSGAKKRKAAKKKKEQASYTINSSTNNDPNGNGDSRSQDERESDCGSIASQGDHIQSNVTDDKSVESTNLSRSDDVVAFKIEKDSGSKEDHDKSSSSSSSSRSSSDDESQVSEKKLKEEGYNFGSQVTTDGNVDKDVDSNSYAETANVDNSVEVEPMLSVLGEVDHAIEIFTNNSVPDVVEPVLKESDGKTFSSPTTSTAESSFPVEKTQHLDPHEFSENRPLVASTPPVAKRTSVFSCCGLFDAFTGSGR